MAEPSGKTVICSVVFLDIVEYTRRPVAEQIALKEAFNQLINESIKDVQPSDRILLDSGDGAALCFLGDPENALFVAIDLRDRVRKLDAPKLGLSVRFGVNLGPVRLVKDINDRPNVLGDGINVAQRVMSFAQPNQILVSRSFFDVVSCLSQEYGELFLYRGAHADKHVREHELYEVEVPSAAVGVDTVAVADNPFAGARRPEAAAPPEPDARRASGVEAAPPAAARPSSLRFVGVGAAVLALGLAVWLGGRRDGRDEAVPVAGAPAPAAAPLAAGAPADSPAGRVGETPAAASATSEGPASARSATASALTARAAGEAAAAKKTEAGRKTGDAAASARRVESASRADPAMAEVTHLSLVPVGKGGVKPPSGTVELVVQPWGYVLIDDRRLGTSPPLKTIELPVGWHYVEIRGQEGFPYGQQHQVKAGETIRINKSFP